jgi:hypothetical protein
MPISASEEDRADLTPFPDPSTFAILPDIYLLLSRIALLQHQSTNGTVAPLTEDPQASNPLNLTPLDVKDLTAAIYPLKQKIQKAKEAVAGMIGVERSIEEQDAEIKSLEARSQALKTRLSLLADIAGRGLEKSQIMEGVETQQTG